MRLWKHIGESWPLLTIVAVLATLAMVFTSGLGTRANANDSDTGMLRPLEEDPPQVELAPYMGELGRLTHKMSLAIGATNVPLASFYAYESLELLGEIQTDVPEYEDQPIALLIDRLGTPSYNPLKELLHAEDGSVSPDALMGALEGIVRSCNACHAATQHGFIKITAETKTNPFNQDFTP